MRQNLIHTFLSTALLLVYFFSVTPMHMYGHDIFDAFDVEVNADKSHTDSSDKSPTCDYINGVQSNIGIGFFPPVAYYLFTTKLLFIDLKSDFTFRLNLIKSKVYQTLSLRAPPYFA